MNQKEVVGMDVDAVIDKAVHAGAVFNGYSQDDTDRIVRAVYEAGFNNRVKLAKLAVEETGIGNWQDKVIKNVVATQLVHEDIRRLKTVGIISENEELGIVEMAQPLGPILAVTPVTNPTSTVMFKILIALKTRNPIIIGPHPRAVRCSCEAAKICYEAALAADAPEDCVQWVEKASPEQNQQLMRHKKLALILATGGQSLINAAYSSGTPALGVGPGNVPVFVEKTADMRFAAEQIIMSKTFDNGTICASEQSIIVEKDRADEFLDELKKQKAHMLSESETQKVAEAAFDIEKGLMRPSIVGQTAESIAKMANIDVPAGTKLLVAPLKGVGKEHPMSSEVLACVIAFYSAEDFNHAVKICIDLNFHGGIGHTASLFSNDEEKIKAFALVMNAGRVVVNTPSSQGAVGGIFNKIHASFTLGCGTGGKNITTDNITAKHLINIQRICRRRQNQRFVDFDKNFYLDESLDVNFIEKKYNNNA